jgi:hypothetical protein
MEINGAADTYCGRIFFLPPKVFFTMAEVASIVQLRGHA